MKKLLLLLLMTALPALANLNFTTYYIPSWPPNISNPGTPVSTGTVPNMYYNWGSGVILNSGLADHVLVHFTGYVNWPGTAGTQRTVTFYAATDDGFKMTVGGVGVANGIGDLHGPGYYNYSASVTLTGGQAYSLDAWFAEWGGGAVVQLFWDLGDGNGIVAVPSSAFSLTPPAPQYSSNITVAQQSRVTAYFARTIANNSVYIDQAGNYNTVSITQVGLNNLVTGVATQNATVSGNHNNITVRQGGDGDSGRRRHGAGEHQHRRGRQAIEPGRTDRAHREPRRRHAEHQRQRRARDAELLLERPQQHREGIDRPQRQVAQGRRQQGCPQMSGLRTGLGHGDGHCRIVDCFSFQINQLNLTLRSGPKGRVSKDEIRTRCSIPSFETHVAACATTCSSG